MYLKESSFPDCWKVSPVVLVFKNFGEKSTSKNYQPVGLLSIKSCKLVNKKFFDSLEKYGFFSDFQYGFRPSQALVDLLTIVSDKIAGAFNRFRTTQAITLAISRASDKV